MTFPSSLLGATSRAQVDGLDPADGSKTSGHRYTWSVYKLSRQRIERIEHRARPGQDRVRLSPAPARAHLESINFDVRPSVHSGRLRGPSGLGPTPRTGTHGVVLHFEIIAHYTFSCPAQWATSRRPAPGARGAPCRSRTSLLTVSKSRNAHVTRRPYQELLDLPSSKFAFGGGRSRTPGREGSSCASNGKLFFRLLTLKAILFASNKYLRVASELSRRSTTAPVKWPSGRTTCAQRRGTQYTRYCRRAMLASR